MHVCVAQQSIFFESIGNVSSTQTLNAHVLQDGFDQDAFIFSQGGAANPVDIRSSSNSWGSYVRWDSVAASGGANVWFSSSNERGFSIHSIRASAFDSLQLYFAYRKESASSNADFHLDYSTNQGQSWDSLSGIALPADSLSTGWYYIGPIHLPDSAAVTSLALRWIKTQGSMRIDDISLIGNLSNPFIESATTIPALAAFADYQPSSWSKIELNTYAFQTGDSVLARVNKPFELSIDTLEGIDSLLFTVDSSYMPFTCYVRLSDDTLRNAYSDSIYFSHPSSSTLAIPVSGQIYYAGESAVYWDCETASFTNPHLGLWMRNASQRNNKGTTQFLSSSSSSDNYVSASGNQNAAMAVHTGSLDTSASSHISWVVVPQSGKEVLINGLSFGARSTSTGPQSWCLRSSDDSFHSDLYSGNIQNNSTWQWISRDSLVLRFQDSLEFRLYVYDGTGSASTNIANFRLDDLSLQLTRWNARFAAAYRSQKNGNLLDSSLWTYGYYATLYAETSILPNDSQSMEIRAEDSCWITEATEIHDLKLQGVLDISGKQLRLLGALTGSGSLRADEESILEFEGTDSSVLRLTSGSSLRSLRLENGSPEVYVQDSLFINHFLYPGAGTLHSQGFLHLSLNQGKSAYIDPKAKGSVEGALCMQTLIPGSNSGWRGFMSPLDTVTMGQLGTQIEIHLQNTASSGDNRNAYQWTESSASWSAVASSSFSLHDSAVNLYLFNPDSTLIELCGLYDTSEVNYGALSFSSSTSQSEGWHFIGNPFPSPLRWSGGQFPSGVNGNYSLWSVADGNYRNWNGSVGSAGDLIPPFQGFWVKVNQGLSQDFILKNTFRDSGFINHFGKKSGNTWHIEVAIKDPNQGYNDAVFLIGNMDESAPICEAPKLFGNENAPQLWLKTSSDSLSIGRHENQTKIPLYLSIAKSGVYQLTLDYVGPNSNSWVLLDHHTSWTYAIANQAPIQLSLEAGYYPERFTLEQKSLGDYVVHSSEIPSIHIQNEYLIIQNPVPKKATIYSMDGRLLGSHFPMDDSLGKFGPLPFPSGIYLLELTLPKGIYRQLIYLP